MGSKTLSFIHFQVVPLHQRAKRIPSALIYFFRPNCPSERQCGEFGQCSEQPPSHQAQAQAACKLGYFKWLTHKSVVIHVPKFWHLSLSISPSQSNGLRHRVCNHIVDWTWSTPSPHPALGRETQQCEWHHSTSVGRMSRSNNNFQGIFVA